MEDSIFQMGMTFTGKDVHREIKSELWARQGPSYQPRPILLDLDFTFYMVDTETYGMWKLSQKAKKRVCLADAGFVDSAYLYDPPSKSKYHKLSWHDWFFKALKVQRYPYLVLSDGDLSEECKLVAGSLPGDFPGFLEEAFQTKELIFIPSSTGQGACWAKPNECLLDGLINMETKHAVITIYRDVFPQVTFDLIKKFLTDTL
ncbi:Uu.00g141780.m01.CDS01 [Anthostomella pinea]|uniref:Uu.00g141780.m01.CDS01 n=1 Tax=Anthostomella pinea TaxID=933095 RepID=A0AAI8YLH1_9PEZI|nr:Uu.00g141780.m01.CDS01 [Anthostomella pinea]